jgi:hypothetical protein
MILPSTWIKLFQCASTRQRLRDEIHVWARVEIVTILLEQCKNACTETVRHTCHGDVQLPLQQGAKHVCTVTVNSLSLGPGVLIRFEYNQRS